MYIQDASTEEHACPGNEFSTGADCSIPADDRRKKKTFRAGALLAAAAVAVIVGVCAASVEAGPQHTQPAAGETVVLPASGTVAITFHNGTFDENWDELIDKAETFSLPAFTGCEIPQPVEADGFTFAAWMLYGEKTDGTVVCYPVEGQITPYDVMQLDPDADGNIAVDVYCAWTQVQESSGSELLLDANGGTPSESRHVIFGPMASESIYFVDVMFDAPVRAGFSFAGWYRSADCSGEAVHVLRDAEFYAATEVSGKAVIDWATPVPIVLYAKWE
ncbi:MAG: InlB B-repeat-containing protein [Oscillospiraceae bacterium]|nr:InlB B-repeat-containing protein [Oscillospiraceae bacterium]